MHMYLLNTSFKAVAVIDQYSSIIWTDRYNEYGDFELEVPAGSSLMQMIQPDYYIWSRDSDHLMIVEAHTIDTDIELGNTVKISGRSLESILDRRIAWGQVNLSGNLQTQIQTLLNDAIINPSNTDRKISNFIFSTSTDTAVTSCTIDAQYTGDTLYDIIHAACVDNNLGFKIILNSSNQFVFSLYSGTNRSYGQSTNPYVIFSPKFDNIINSNYYYSKQELKNVALIGGEGEGASRTYASTGSGTGLSRRELFCDASDISSDTDDGTLSAAEYEALLVTRGEEELAENTETTAFEGEVETTKMFKHGIDFFVGDIVQIVNEYNIQGNARITEFIFSENNGETSYYPTFEMVS